MNGSDVVYFIRDLSFLLNLLLETCEVHIQALEVNCTWPLCEKVQFIWNAFHSGVFYKILWASACYVWFSWPMLAGRIGGKSEHHKLKHRYASYLNMIWWNSSFRTNYLEHKHAHKIPSSSSKIPGHSSRVDIFRSTNKQYIKHNWFTYQYIVASSHLFRRAFLPRWPQ